MRRNVLSETKGENCRNGVAASETDRAPVKTHYLTGRHISFAITSLPVPFSPVMRTEASVGAILETVVVPGLRSRC